MRPSFLLRRRGSCSRGPLFPGAAIRARCRSACFTGSNPPSFSSLMNIRVVIDSLCFCLSPTSTFCCAVAATGNRTSRMANSQAEYLLFILEAIIMMTLFFPSSPKAGYSPALTRSLMVRLPSASVCSSMRFEETYGTGGRQPSLKPVLPFLVQ